MDREDAAICYGFTGGVPAYMELVNPRSSAAENIERLFFNAGGLLYEEPTNLLLQECRAPGQYDAIIQAIASGRSRLNEIATATQIAQSNARTYLKKLISIGIASRELPFGETSNKKATYALSDDMFRFWYRFVPQNMGLIQNGMGKLAFSRVEETHGPPGALPEAAPLAHDGPGVVPFDAAAATIVFGTVANTR